MQLINDCPLVPEAMLDHTSQTPLECPNLFVAALLPLSLKPNEHTNISPPMEPTQL